MNIVGVLSGKRKCLLAIAIAFSTFGNAQLVTYPEGLNTGMPHNDDYTVKVPLKQIVPDPYLLGLHIRIHLSIHRLLQWYSLI